MTPIPLFDVFAFSKKEALLVAGFITMIIIMPVLAVFSLGQNTLSYLANTITGGSDISAISTTTVGFYEGPPVPGDTYAWGNCTYWAYALRLEAGDPIPATWGNAATWASYAQLDGYIVNQTPSVGAIMQTSSVDKGLGHVAYVTSVDPTTGTWTISEMNVKGLDIVDIATYTSSEATAYNFIHDKSS